MDVCKCIVPSRHGGNLNSSRAASPRVRLVYSRTFGDGPRNFESWTSDKNDTGAGFSSPSFHTTSTGGRMSINRCNVHRSSAWRVYNGTMLELMTRRP
ncbi:hypothetical protein TNCV_437651 [Trichonephila clavipes]|nr:hypothetical protein TNCV_437651 [Trichonephila clavipes]